MMFTHRHCVVSGFSFILLVAAFILLLLVAVSLPILKPVYLLGVKSTSIGQPMTSNATELRFGVWGVCAFRYVTRSRLMRHMDYDQRPVAQPTSQPRSPKLFALAPNSATTSHLELPTWLGFLLSSLRPWNIAYSLS
jgi:hypothetical protein